MVQEIITYILIFGSVVYCCYNGVKLFLPQKKYNANSHQCKSSCQGCNLKKSCEANYHQLKIDTSLN